MVFVSCITCWLSLFAPTPACLLCFLCALLGPLGELFVKHSLKTRLWRDPLIGQRAILFAFRLARPASLDRVEFKQIERVDASEAYQKGKGPD
jgi:hypothetical protein